MIDAKLSNEYIKVEFSDQVGVEDLHPLIVNAIRVTLVAHHISEGAITILLTDNNGIQDLNSRFRNKPSPTDVLTFPAPDTMESYIGDIAISIPFAQEQALNRKLKLAEEVQILAIHGTLHLLGFQDETDEEREGMIQEMNRIGLNLDLPNMEDWYTLSANDLTLNEE